MSLKTNGEVYVRDQPCRMQLIIHMPIASNEDIVDTHSS